MNRKHFILVILAGMATTAVCADETEIDYGENVRLAARLMEDHHLSGRPLDDELCEEWGEEFIARLDPRRMYLLRSDVDEFRQAFHGLDGLTQEGDLSFAKHVHRRVKTRVEHAVEIAEDLLAQTHGFDRNESFTRKFKDFATDEKELAERWRLRIKFELLLETSHTSTTEEAIEFLRSRYQGIRDQYSKPDPEELCRIYIDSLATVYDSRSCYFSASEIAMFRVSLDIPNRTIGLALERRNGDYMVTSVPPGRFSRQPYLSPVTLIGWAVIAIRRTDGTVFHLTELSRPRTNRLIASPFGKLHNDDEVILELYNPVTHRRISRIWPRF